MTTSAADEACVHLHVHCVEAYNLAKICGAAGDTALEAVRGRWFSVPPRAKKLAERPLHHVADEGGRMFRGRASRTDHRCDGHRCEVGALASFSTAVAVAAWVVGRPPTLPVGPFGILPAPTGGPTVLRLGIAPTSGPTTNL